MELFTNQVLAGIATGAIYACMALAVVMIYQAIDHLNFAQGEMAMFSTFISWQLMQWGIPYWWAFLITLAFSFAGGIVIERLLFKPLAKAPILTNVAVNLPGIFVGSFLIEVFFSIPGLGREILLAVNRSDYPVIQAFAIYIAVITMVVNLVTDVLYKLVDPRVVLS